MYYYTSTSGGSCYGAQEHVNNPNKLYIKVISLLVISFYSKLNYVMVIMYVICMVINNNVC
jgi:hypothetical protein